VTANYHDAPFGDRAFSAQDVILLFVALFRRSGTPPARRSPRRRRNRSPVMESIGRQLFLTMGPASVFACPKPKVDNRVSPMHNRTAHNISRVEPGLCTSPAPCVEEPEPPVDFSGFGRESMRSTAPAPLTLAPRRDPER